jgi:xanthine dehydrogenase accessory factor
MPTPHGFIENLAALARSGTPFVSVTMIEAIGSTPQDTGSKMLVTASGLHSGTVGGGKVEFKAIQHAQTMLKESGGDAEAHELLEWNLQRDVGMTCGGVVKLFFEVYNHCDWQVVIFGAGHVANAVVQCLGQLECQTTCIDPRPEWLAKISDRARLKKLESADMSTRVVELPEDAFVLCMTMGHATDRPILTEIFRRGRKFPYLGVIGSKAKRAILVRELTAEGIDRQQAESFHCPIGLPLGSNQPGEIAVSVVAQLIQERDRWRGAAKS